MRSDQSILKLIPGLGSVVNATVAAALTTAMGMYVTSYFEETALAKAKGVPAPPLNFDMELFKEFYAACKKYKEN